MSPPNISVLSVSRFDGKKLLVIMSIVVITLVLDSQIGYIADFIPEGLASSWGIAIRSNSCSRNNGGNLQTPCDFIVSFSYSNNTPI